MFEFKTLTQVAFLSLKLSATELDCRVSTPRVLTPWVLGSLGPLSLGSRSNVLRYCKAQLKPGNEAMK